MNTTAATTLNFRDVFLSILCALVLISCREEIVPEIFHPRNDHERYKHMLKKSGLLTTALGQDWIAVAEKSLEVNTHVEIPHQQIFYFPATEAIARTYQFSVRRGEKVNIKLDALELSDAKDSINLFIDLFRQELTGPEAIASADPHSLQLAFEPRHDATYLLRIQPELLRGGRFRLTMERGPMLEFPVAGGRNYDIGSFFGDPRDGGRRRHHGVDIFAKRHTPIVAPCSGYVRFAGVKGLGGKVVWMRNQEKKLTLYFAHLQEIYAKEGDWISTGDTLGTVGNTGNARTTPPHLHFGIYAQGPIDPQPFVSYQEKMMRPVTSELDFDQQEFRARRSSIFVTDQGEKRPILQYQWLEGWSQDHKYLYATLPDGTAGKIPIRDVEHIETEIPLHLNQESFVIREGISTNSPAIRSVSTPESSQVLAIDKHHCYLETTDGNRGWALVSP